MRFARIAGLSPGERPQEGLWSQVTGSEGFGHKRGRSVDILEVSRISGGLGMIRGRLW